MERSHVWRTDDDGFLRFPYARRCAPYNFQESINVTKPAVRFETETLEKIGFFALFFFTWVFPSLRSLSLRLFFCALAATFVPTCTSVSCRFANVSRLRRWVAWRCMLPPFGFRLLLTCVSFFFMFLALLSGKARPVIETRSSKEERK